jgi:hypothetical protein
MVLFVVFYQQFWFSSNADEDESTTTAGGVGGGAGATAHAWMDYMSKTAATYLPTQMTDIFQQDRSFATAKVPAIGRRNVVALTAYVPHLLET